MRRQGQPSCRSDRDPRHPRRPRSSAPGFQRRCRVGPTRLFGQLVRKLEMSLVSSSACRARALVALDASSTLSRFSRATCTMFAMAFVTSSPVRLRPLRLSLLGHPVHLVDGLNDQTAALGLFPCSPLHFARDPVDVLDGRPHLLAPLRLFLHGGGRVGHPLVEVERGPSDSPGRRGLLFDRPRDLLGQAVPSVVAARTSTRRSA